MSTPIPPPLRAAAGLAALAIDSVRKVPQQLVGLPVLAVSTALQASLKAQQAYAELVARGDEVLGQLRGQQDAPWATFDDDPPRSAFDATADDVDRGLDPDLEPDVLTVEEAGLVETEFLGAPDLDEAGAGGLDVVEITDLRPADPLTVALNGSAAIDLSRAEGSGTEPGADLPADAVADAAATEAVLDGLPAEPLDGYLTVEPPIAGYDELTIPQLRGRLRSLSAEQVEALVSYERGGQARPPYLTMLENRLLTLRSR